MFNNSSVSQSHFYTECDSLKNNAHYAKFCIHVVFTIHIRDLVHREVYIILVKILISNKF